MTSAINGYFSETYFLLFKIIVELGGKCLIRRSIRFQGTRIVYIVGISYACFGPNVNKLYSARSKIICFVVSIAHIRASDIRMAMVYHLVIVLMLYKLYSHMSLAM
jgi:hypothetical protein